MLRPARTLRQAALCVFVLIASAASAHEVRPALAEIAFGGGGAFTIDFTLNAEALLAGIGPEHDDTDASANKDLYDRLRAAPPPEVAAKFDAFAPQFLAGLTIRTAGAAVPVGVEGIAVPPVGDVAVARDSRIVVRGRAPEGAETITFAWAPAFGAVVFRTAADDAADGYSAYLQNGEASAPVPLAGGASQSTLDVFVNYVGVGFEHIAPLGVDHILFVVGLFLLSTQLRPLLIQITSFTVAHTVTLALGLFGVIRIAPEIVEPLIALSIVYVAVENILSARLTVWRPILVFAFGLLHGLGFAGVLTEFGLPQGQYVPGLIGFNIGVELGQIFVVALCFAAVGWWAGRKPWYRRVVVIPGSVAIGVVGAFWVVERTLL